MEVEVTVLTRRGAAVMHRSQRASAPRIGLGRGTDNEVPLADIRVGLHVAALVPRTDGIAIEKLGNSPLIINGESVESAPLKPNDEILLGPYKITVLAPPEGCDGAIQIELVQPMGAALERLTIGARIGLERAGINQRVYAWTGFLAIVVVCLAVPIIVFTSGMMRPWHKDTVSSEPKFPRLVGLSWNAGTFSNAHRFFAADCATCHQGAFAGVADKACLACHATVGNHVPRAAKLGAVGDQLASLNCVDCHSEHRGIEGSVIREARFCLSCHRNLNETAPAAEVRDIGGFPRGHPQFRATLVADAAQAKTVRVELGTTPPPRDQPGIKFSHKAHLDTLGATALGDRQVKGCADCHVPEPSGQGFLPITYKNQCQRCHELNFDKVALPWPDARVPHGDDAGVIAAVWNYYAGLALQGQTPASPAPTPAVERRGAGMPSPPPRTPAPADSQAWVMAKSVAALHVVFDERRGCAYCHYGKGADGAFDTDKVLADALPPKANPPHVIAPVMLRARFLPQAAFDHASHRGMTCDDCHAARQSQTSNEVLIPGIDNCVKCHGTETAALRAQSTCITCHYFHRGEFGLMRMTAGATQ